MSGMQTSDRNQIERVDLSVPSTGLKLGSRRGLAIYAVIATAVLGFLGYWAIKEIDGWASALVLGAIIMTAIGLMIAVRPNRRTPWG